MSDVLAGWLILGAFYLLMLVFVWSLLAAAALGDDMAAAALGDDDE